MSKTQSENTLQNDSVDSGSITFKIGVLISRLNHLQKIGDITIVNTPIKELDYSKALNEYKELSSIATKTTQFPSPADKDAFLFNLNKYQAIIDFRVLGKNNAHLKLSEHNTHLSKAYKDNPDRNQSIIELGQWNTRYKALPAEQQKKMSASSSLLEGHFSNLTTAVNSYLTQKKYTEALKEMDGLEKSSNSKVVSLYVGIYIAAGDFPAALEHCKNTMEYKGENVKMKEDYCGFYKSLAEQFKAANATAQANEAAKIAESYKPEAEHQKLMTLSREQQATNDKLSMELARQKQEAKELADKYAAAIKKLTDIETKQIIVTKKQELQARQDAELEIFEAEFKVQQQNQFQVKKEQINALTKTEPSAPFELPPTYSSATKTTKGHQNVVKTEEHQGLYPFNMVNETIPTTNTGTGPVATTIISGAGDGSVVTADDSKDTEVTTIETVVNNAIQEQINEITKILNSDKPNMNRVAKCWEKAIDRHDGDLYRIIEDTVILPSLASSYLKLGKLAEAKKTVNKIIKDAKENGKKAYDEIEDYDVLNLIATKYNKGGFLEESIEACKKAVSQPGYKPCAESYQLLKEIGETKNLTDKVLALDAFNVAKDNAADDLQKYHIHATIIKMHLSLNKLDDAKEEYAELLNNVSYQTVYKLAKTPEEAKHLFAVDADLAKYKLLFDKYKANPTPEAAEEFYYAILSITKCEIKAAALMETNLRLHGPGPTKDIEELINGNLGNKTISRLNECYKKWDSQITTNDSNAKYVEAIGDIDHCLLGGEW